MTLLTGDLHWSDNPRDAYRHAFVDWLSATIKRLDIERLIILGDLTEAKDYHSAALVNQIVGHIHRLSRQCYIYIVKGNHDYKGNPNNPFFAFLTKIPNVTWIGNPTAFKLPELGTVIFLPHTTNAERDWANITFGKYSWAFTHNTFTGAIGDNGRKLEGVPFFPGIKTISGDVHVPQKLGSVTYVGAPYTIDFGDSFAPRLLQIKAAKLISIPCEGPQKRLVEVDSPNELAKLTGLNKGDILKIRMRIADAARAPEFRAKAVDWCSKRGYIPHAVLITTTNPEARTRQPAVRKTDEELITTYAKARGVDPKTLEVGKAIVKGA